MLRSVIFATLLSIFFTPNFIYGHSPTDQVFQIFQFPDEHIPIMDGDLSDWEMVPTGYLFDYRPHAEVHRDSAAHDLSDLHIIRAGVGWNDNSNRLYFFAEVFDDIWRFKHSNIDSLDTPNSRMTGAHVHGADIWEIVIDADHAGDQVINFSDEPEIEFRHRSAYTQNYHLYIPPLNGHYWHWLWGKAVWSKQEKFSNIGWSAREEKRINNFWLGDTLEHLDPGVVKYECYLTPFDDLHYSGPESSIIHDLTENSIIGLGWGFIDADENPNTYDAFWSLNKEGKIYGYGEFLADFKLMPVDKEVFNNQ